MSGYYMDKDGNLIHTRSGDMIKRRIEVNKFTGEGELVDVKHKNSKPRKEKKKTKEEKKLEMLLNGLRSLELDVSWAVTMFGDKCEDSVTNKNLEVLLKNLGTLKSNIDIVIAFAKKFGDNCVG